MAISTKGERRRFPSIAQTDQGKNLIKKPIRVDVFFK
jgi:hypothetical protein